MLQKYQACTHKQDKESVKDQEMCHARIGIAQYLTVKCQVANHIRETTCKWWPINRTVDTAPAVLREPPDDERGSQHARC